MILGAIFAFAGRELASFIQTPIPAYGSPDVWSLTGNGVEWDFAIGTPPRVAPRKVVLPLKVFRHAERQPGDLLYYSTRVTLPEVLRGRSDPLTLHSLFIWARHYEIYADGELIDAGESQQVQVNLPASTVRDGVVDLVIKVDPGDLAFQGVAHWGEVVIGTAPALAPIRHLAHELKTTFYLWFVIPKLTLCLLFGLLYLLLSQAKEHFTLVLFGAFGALKLLFFTTYADRVLPAGIHGPTLAWVMDCATQLSLMAFLYQYFRWRSKALTRVFWVCTAGLAVALVIGLLNSSLQGTTATVIIVRKVLRLVALASGLGFSVLSIRRFRIEQAPDHRRIAAWSVCGFFALYLALVIAEHTGLFSGAVQGVVGFAFELLVFMLLAALTVVEFRATLLSRNEERRGRLRAEEEASLFKAIANTTQMLAHDVRKPFSMLRSVFRVIEGETDLARLQRGAKSLTTELDRSLASVDGMLADVMELGAATELKLMPADIEAVFADAARLLLPSAPTGVTVEWDLGHRHKALINAVRIGRVALNLFENALHATGAGGHLWVKTAEVTNNAALGPMIELTLGNSGSFVPEVDRDKIFDIFFTRGKSQGTGLGLAVARQVVERHGGTIRCLSHPTMGTEFKLTVRASQELASPVSTDLPRATPEPAAAAVSIHTWTGPTIALVEDDVFLRDAWTLSVRDARLELFSTGEALIERCLADADFLATLAVVVTDFHLGTGQCDGAELAARLKNLRRSLPVVLCSESGAQLTDHHQVAFATVLEKRPYSWHELRLLLATPAVPGVRVSSSNS